MDTLGERLPAKRLAPLPAPFLMTVRSRQDGRRDAAVRKEPCAMPHRRILAVLALAALTSLSPALAQPRPTRAEKIATAVSLFDLLLDQFAQIREKVLGGDTSDAGSSLDPNGARNDSGSSLDPDGAK